MEELIPILAALALGIHGTLLTASAIRFRRWSGSREENLIIAVPYLFVAFATAGSLLTVGLNGLTGLSGLAVLLATGWRGKLTIDRPFFSLQWHLTGLLMWITVTAVKFYALYDFDNGDFLCSFHDDYSYIMQTNLLDINGKEGLFWELIRGAFGMEFQYSFYHYSEFYIILLFKSIFGGNTFLWFNFFLKGFIHTLALICTTAFFHNQFRAKYTIFQIGLLSFLIFSTLRFNLADDLVAPFLGTAYSKSVFFQNYYFPSPLSYHVSYKISIAFIFILPLIEWIRTGRTGIPEFASVVLLGASVTIAIIPICFTTLFLYAIDKLFPRYVKAAAFLSIAAGIFLVSYFLNSYENIFRYSYSVFFSSFNLLFENFYWQLFYIGCLIVFLVRTSAKNKLMIAGVLAFPLVYLFPSVLFKVFSLFILIVAVRLAIKRNILRNLPLRYFAPSIAFLYLSCLCFPGIANLSQVYSNYLFPVISLILLQYLFQLDPRMSKPSIAVVLLIVLLVNLPAVAYDNRVPLHRESIPDNFFREPVLNERVVRVLSINNYPSVPFLHRYMLGQGLMNRLDNVVITNGGFEYFGPKEIEVFRQTGYLKLLQRNPAYEDMILNRNSLKEFIEKRKVKIVLLEKTPDYQQKLRILLPMTRKRYRETVLGYDILMLK
jgi:hypothetical protein